MAATPTRPATTSRPLACSPGAATPTALLSTRRNNVSPCAPLSAPAVRDQLDTAVAAKCKAILGSVQRFARHANPATTMIYDDNRRDFGGEIACSLAEGLGASVKGGETPA